MSIVRAEFQLSNAPPTPSTSEVIGYIRSMRFCLHLERDLDRDLEHRTASRSDSLIVRLFLLISRIAFFPWQVPWKPPTRCQINP
jgi:hypothetical protein